MRTLFITGFIFYLLSLSLCSQSIYSNVNYDTVKAQRFDMGKMWTFENPPLSYFQQEYNFTPTDEWLEKTRKAALKFANWCSASFVSEDGLVMTNHHCARENLPSVQKEGENLLRDGFIANTLNDERKMPGIFVNQLIVIRDVTKEIISAMNSGSSDKEKISLKEKKIASITKDALNEHPELIFEVVSLYNGGKYSLYGYKRYNDVRLVFAPDLRTAKMGGDFDNFTYPRYGLDCTFFRVYDDDGKPLKTKYFFKWSLTGPKEDDVVFVIGNPGRTSRLNTVAQILYNRDVQYPMMTDILKDLYQIYYKKVSDNNTEDFVLVSKLYSVGNSLKVYQGTYEGLNDPYLIARKVAFEKDFRNAVSNDSALKEKYFYIWEEIEKSREQAKSFAKEVFAFSLNPFFTSDHFTVAKELIKIAEQTKTKSEDREDLYKDENLSKLVSDILNKKRDAEIQNAILLADIKMFNRLLGPDHEIVKLFSGSLQNEAALNYVLNKTIIFNAELIVQTLKQGYKQFITLDDPFIQMILKTRDKLEELRKKSNELRDREAILNQELGKAVYEVYGDAIPPDATFTLRIADGIVKGYDYNGTRAPVKTTFYGVLDRHFSFDKKFPFNLNPIWDNLPDEFDLNTPLNFITTCDIIGGNSGSPVINTKGEIVGLAFDGNLESLPSNFIFTTEANRTVSVHNEGMIEAIRDLYKMNRLAKELLNGRIMD